MRKVKKVRGKYEKAKYSKLKCFLCILGETEIHAVSNFQNIGLVNFLVREAKRMGKHKHSEAMGFLHISCVGLIHTIPKI